MQRCIVATLIGLPASCMSAHISYSPTSPASPFVVRPSDQTVAHSRRPDKVVADMVITNQRIKDVI
jgi:hypothetical protein